MKNLTKLYKEIPTDEIEVSKNWYRKAHKFAERLSNDYKVSFDKVCGVISALSPACSWSKNKVDAEKMLVCFVSGGDWQMVPFSTYGNNVVKAWNILTDSTKQPSEFFNTKTGAKTYNFYFNILDPNSKDFVTIDRHMVAIIDGRFGERSGSYRLTPKQYRDLQNDLNKMAKKLKVLPNELQAILWDYHVKQTQPQNY